MTNKPKKLTAREAADILKSFLEAGPPKDIMEQIAYLTAYNLTLLQLLDSDEGN